MELRTAPHIANAVGGFESELRVVEWMGAVAPFEWQRRDGSIS